MYKSKLVYMISFILILIIIIIGVMPIIFITLLSFSGGWRWPQLLPGSFTFEGWKYVLLQSPTTIESIKTSFLIALIVTAVNILISLPAADALGRYDFKGKNIIEIFLLMPIVVPSLVVMMGVHKTFIKLGLTESILGVILAHMILTLPYMIKAIMVSYNNLGFQWEDQGRVLGAGRFKRFIYITLPFLLPGIIAGSSLTILISLSQYIITLLIGGGMVTTLPIVMFPFINGGNGVIGAVYSIIFAIVSLISLKTLDVFLKIYYE